MATNFNTGPYFDDFDKDNHFYRVLFKPGYAVQARELNQLQSILQHQVSSVGNHLFKKNSIVIPGGVALIESANIVSITNINDPSVLVGKTITNASNFDFTDDATLDGYITAIVLGYKAATINTPAALYVKYFKSQDDGRITFNQSEELKTVDSSLLTFNVDSTIGSTLGKVATISAGTFYTKEVFVDCSQQSIIIEVDNSVTTNCTVGLNIVESIVTSDDDSALLDNANGTPNQYAPGADRYKIDLVLERIDDTTSLTDDMFIKMMSIENNVITYINNKTQYAEIMTMLARRTYDTNGNFIVRGLDTSITEAGDANYIWTNISKGKGYLGGYEYEQLVTTPIAIQKPRDAAYQQEVGPITQYTVGMTYFYAAGASLLKEIPTKNSLIQFTDTNPIKITFNATSGSVVDLSANTITKTNHNLQTGVAVTYSNGGGTSIGGLTSGNTYYVIRISSSVIKLASSYANAIALSAIDLTSGAVGTSHVIEKTYSVVGYGIFKDIEFGFGTPNVNDVYKLYFDYISLEKGFVLDNIGGIKSINGEGTAILHELSLVNVFGTFAAGNVIMSATNDAQFGLMYNVVNNRAYVIKNTTATIPNTTTVKDTTSNATATRSSSFLTNYTTSSIPMVEVDTDTIKTLRNNAGMNNTAFSTIKAASFNVTGVSTLSANVDGADDVFEEYSTTDYFAFISTAGAEQIVDLTNLVSFSNAGKTYNIDVQSGSPMIGNTVWVYSTVNKIKVSEAQKSVVTVTSGDVIATPSSSWMALGHQDVVGITKVVDGKTVSTATAAWAANVATITTDAVHGINVNDVVVVRNIKSATAPTGAFGLGYNGKFTVASIDVPNKKFTYALTIDPGTYDTSSDGNVALPPDITNDTDITSRFTFQTGTTPYLCGTGFIKLNKGTTSPQGQIAVQYQYYSVGSSGNYISVDSYGLYSSPDLSYIGDIDNIVDDKNNTIEVRRYIDFRTRPSNYFFKNLATIKSSTDKLILRDLNLSLHATNLIGKYVIGPSHQNGATITAVTFNAISGNTELTLSSTAGTFAAGAITGTYYIGLYGSGLSLIDSGAGSRAFDYPKDSTRFTYNYVKFLPKHVMVMISRTGDLLKIDYQNVSGRAEAASYQRDEYKLPLAYLFMKPYTVSIRDVVLEKFENPVYHMLDIHNINRRVDRNDYYTSLALEGNTNQQAIDADNAALTTSSRGIWAENFMDVSNQDYFSNDFACTIYDKSYVAPGTVTRTLSLELDTTLNQSTWQRTTSAITLPYTEVRAFGSKSASRFNNLNPFNVINWTGKLTLNPSVDNWVDTTVPASPTVTGPTTNPPLVQPPPPIITQPPVVLPQPPVEEIVVELTNFKYLYQDLGNRSPSWNGNYGISFDWKTNLGKVGRVNVDYRTLYFLVVGPFAQMNAVNKWVNGYGSSYKRLVELLKIISTASPSAPARSQSIGEDAFKNIFINKKYNDPGVKEFLNLGTNLNQRPLSYWQGGILGKNIFYT